MCNYFKRDHIQPHCKSFCHVQDLIGFKDDIDKIVVKSVGSNNIFMQMSSEKFGETSVILFQTTVRVLICTVGGHWWRNELNLGLRWMLISSNSSALVDSNKSRCRKLCLQDRRYEIIDLPLKCVRNGLYSEITSIVQTRCIIHATKTTRRTTRSTKVHTLRVFSVTFVFILDKVFQTFVNSIPARKKDISFPFGCCPRKMYIIDIFSYYLRKLRFMF